MRYLLLLISFGVVDLVSANIYQRDSYRLSNRDLNHILRQRDRNPRHQHLSRREMGAWLKAKPIRSSSNSASSMSRASSGSSSPRSQASSQDSFQSAAATGIQEVPRGKSKSNTARPRVDDKAEVSGPPSLRRPAPVPASWRSQFGYKPPTLRAPPPKQLRTDASSTTSSPGSSPPSSPTSSSSSSSKGNKLGSWLPSPKGIFSKFRKPGRGSSDSGLSAAGSDPSTASSLGSSAGGGYTGTPVQYPIGGGEYVYK